MKRYFFTAILLAVITLTSCNEEKFRMDEGYIFGTTYHITYLSKNDLKPEIERRLNEIDMSLSMYNKNSTLSKLNDSIYTYDLSKDSCALYLIKSSIEISGITNGAFDITVAPLVNIWGFGYQKNPVETADKIDSIKQFTGYKHIKIEGSTFKKDDYRTKLDASAVAKGYACDLIGKVLSDNGIKNYLVEIGGEIVSKGHNPHGLKWTIGINDVEDDSLSSNMKIRDKLHITNKAVATSGNYRKFYIKDGKKYAHTINPKTGYPVQKSVLSVTVITEDCLSADAFATSFMVLGLEESLKIIEANDIDALFICADGDSTKIYETPGIEAYRK